MNRNDIPQAEQLAQGAPDEAPTDVPAIRMLAEVAVRVRPRRGREEPARALPRARAGLPACALQLAVLLHRRNDPRPAPSPRSSACSPRTRAILATATLHAVLLSRRRRIRALEPRSIANCSQEYPSHAKVWLSYGHALKTEGQQEESIDAYRRSIAHRTRLRRGLLEPRQSQDLPLHAGGHRRHARRASRTRRLTT